MIAKIILRAGGAGNDLNIVDITDITVKVKAKEVESQTVTQVTTNQNEHMHHRPIKYVAMTVDGMEIHVFATKTTGDTQLYPPEDAMMHPLWGLLSVKPTKGL